MQMLRLLILGLLLGGSAFPVQSSSVNPKQNPSSPPLPAKEAGAQQKPLVAAGNSSPSDDDIKHAQRDELDAERKYYQAQTANIAAKQPLWQRLAPVITPVGALLAAFVALFSFVSNYQTTLRNQQDTQFFEALKRFGDKDSPPVRASAAGLLAELGTRRRFLRTSLDQLTVGLLLEENAVVLEAIRDALLKLMELESWSTLWALRQQNLTLQKELAQVLTDFLAVESQEQNAAITDEVWQTAAAVSGFRPLILQTLVKRVESIRELGKTPFVRSLEDSRLRRRRGIVESVTVAESLRKAAARLRSNLTVLTEAILRFQSGSLMDAAFLSGADFGIATTHKLQISDSQLQDIKGLGGGLPNSTLYHSEFQGADWYNTNLEGSALFSSGFEGARLSKVNLQNADLQFSRLAGATLSECKLDGAKLYKVEIDDTTDFYKTNWWAADFTRVGELDEALLTKLHDRVLRVKNEYDSFSIFGSEVNLTNWLDKAHPAVRDFVVARQRMQSETPVPSDPDALSS
jgi:hypothetical protein